MTVLAGSCSVIRFLPLLCCFHLESLYLCHIDILGVRFIFIPFFFRACLERLSLLPDHKLVFSFIFL